MRRAPPYILGLLLVLLVGAGLWWVMRDGGPPPTRLPVPQAARPAAPVGSLALPLLAATLAGVAGGALAGWLTGRESARHLQDLSSRLGELEKEHRSAAAQRHEQPTRTLSSAGSAEREPRRPQGRDSWFADRQEPVQVPRATLTPARSVQEPRPMKPSVEAVPEPQGETIEEITARFGRVTSGQLSRSGFARFFEDLGFYGGVRAERGGTAITADMGGEALLTSVNSAGRILVFPSYEFVSNQPTQFSTIASVPDEVASIFDLTRGDGELVVLRPAVFVEADGEARRVSKGELGGFAG